MPPGFGTLIERRHDTQNTQITITTPGKYLYSQQLNICNTAAMIASRGMEAENYSSQLLHEQKWLQILQVTCEFRYLTPLRGLLKIRSSKEISSDWISTVIFEWLQRYCVRKEARYRFIIIKIKWSIVLSTPILMSQLNFKFCIQVKFR